MFLAFMRDFVLNTILPIRLDSGGNFTLPVPR